MFVESTMIINARNTSSNEDTKRFLHQHKMEDKLNIEDIRVSDELMFYLRLINNWGFGQCVTVVGIITNVINIIIFLCQGAKDSINVSLLALAISDLGSLIFLLLLNLCFTPPILVLDLPFYPNQIMWHFGWLHIIFARITTGITAWIMFERCLCIIVPLKIKIWMTPQRTRLYITLLHVFMFGHVIPIFYTSRYAWKFDLARNKSVLGITFLENRNEIEESVFILNNAIPTFFFMCVIVCTFLLVRQLRKKSRWRQQTAHLTREKAVPHRDTKVFKMVILISAVFIFCFTPGAVLQL